MAGIHGVPHLLLWTSHHSPQSLVFLVFPQYSPYLHVIYIMDHNDEFAMADLVLWAYGQSL